MAAIADPRLTPAEQHRICQPSVLALYLAARVLGIRQGRVESERLELEEGDGE
jgi:hypothetical protein